MKPAQVHSHRLAVFIVTLLCSFVYVGHSFDPTKLFRKPKPDDLYIKASKAQDAITTPLESGLSEPDQATKAHLSRAYGKLPLSFEANQGQTNSQVKFFARGAGYGLYLTATEAILALRNHQPHNPPRRTTKGSMSTKAHTTERSVLRMKLVGANSASKVTGVDELEGKTNYFIGNDATKWRTNISNYRKVHYKDVYSGIDLVYYGNQQQLEYDFVVAPGANLTSIKLTFEGAQRMQLEPNGDLVLYTERGEIRHRKPVIFQEEDGIRQEIAGGYLLTGANQLGFQVAEYDTTKPLIIDPVLIYSTYLGGSGLEGTDTFGRWGSISVDSSGNAFLTGISTNFPSGPLTFPTTPGAFQPTAIDTDAFVTKLNAAGTALIYSTFLGGTGYDGGTAIAVDSLGHAYVTGRTGSPNFPITAGAFQTQMTFGSGNSIHVFVTKLNASGSGLAYSTYLGGDGNDASTGLALDSVGNVYLSGNTTSTTFPSTSGAFQTTHHGDTSQPDGFVTKLNATGMGLHYSSYLGGSNFDSCDGIAIDTAGNAYVTGQTSSVDFPTTPGAFQTTLNSSPPLSSSFVTKFNTTGGALVYSTFLGGSTSGFGIDVNSAGNAFVTGQTGSSFPTTAGAFQTFYGGGSSDGFVTKLNVTGTALSYSTFLGGSSNENLRGGAIKLDSSGNAHLTGGTSSSDFPITAGAFQTSVAGNDAFFAKLNADGSALIDSSYMGGSGFDSGNAIALDSLGNSYVTGFTLSTNFPTTPGAFQTANRGAYDAFIAKINSSTGPTPSPTPEVVLRLQSNFSISDNASRANPVQLLGSNLSGTFSSLEVKYEGRNTPTGQYNAIILEYPNSTLDRFGPRVEFFPNQPKSTNGLGVHTDVWRASDYSSPIVFNPAKYYAVMLYQLDSRPLGTATNGYSGGCYVQEEPVGQYVVCNPSNLQDIYFVLKIYDIRPPPEVFSITPSIPVSSSADQDVFVSGANFQQNLSVDISFPGGGGTTLSGAQIQNVTENSFIMRATLNAAGNWSIKVRNPDNQASASLPFTVSSGGPSPFITSINPSSPTALGADQNLVVNGGNFQSGLRVNATFPNGGIATLQGTGQIQNVTPNSFTMRITLNTEGPWKIRVINPNNSQSSQFSFNVQPAGPAPSGLPTSVLSPVIGPLRVTTSNQGTSDGKWEFNQHKTGYHTPTGGISLSNDTYAWDANLYTSLSGNADVGKTVFAVADGVVVSYVGLLPGGGPGAVLVAHPNAQSPVWFSAYLHMVNVRVTLNQSVNPSTVLGDIGRTGANNDHLHFVLYSGQNTRGNLRSFNAEISERLSSASNAPTISLIEPSMVNQSSQPQLITINGTNFQPDSIIEAQDPNGQSFTITNETIAGSTGQITEVTSTTMKARVPFAFDGNYDFSIINRANSVPGATRAGKTSGASVTGSTTAFAVSSSCANCTVYSTPGSRPPVIIIPGIMGSRIGERLIGNLFEEIFPSLPLDSYDHLKLKNHVGFGNPINERPIVATDIFKTYLGFKDVYGTLIDSLTGPYRGYRLYQVSNPNERTLSGCDTSQTGANLFIFPYDWRSGNEQSARDLKGFVDCIKKIHDPNNSNANFKVDIIAHSMGGLVARRYILEGLYGTTQNYDPKVNKLVTLGTPWLGAPKFILALEKGEVEGVSTGLHRLMLQDDLRTVARYMPGAHELIPSSAYSDKLRDTNLGDFPFGENGWDFNDSDEIERMYDSTKLEAIMNRHSPDGVILPGTNTNVFHDKKYSGKPLQDDWTGDQTGVTYYNFIGRCLNDRGELNTLGSIIATSEWYQDWKGAWREKKYLATKMSRGDCTVPEISSMRQSNNGNYLGPAIPGVFENVDHGGLPNDSRVISAIDCLFAGGDSNLCINQQGQSRVGKSNQAVATPVYDLKILGSPMALISDSFGNTTSPLTTSTDEGVASIFTTVTGEDSLSALIPSDQNYKVLLRTSASPLVVTILKVEGSDATSAIRYLDLSIPPDVWASFELTPQGVTDLRYDSNADGTFDTTVNPTITVVGTAARDIEPPVVTVIEAPQSPTSQIVLTATDAGTGVQRIMYSLNGTSFQLYTSPLLVDPSENPTIYAFADDNVANRSGLFTYELGSVGLRIDSVSALAGRASGGQQLTLTGAFAELSAVTLGGASASWSYTNGGGDTSAITVTTPAHAMGAVQVDLTLASGNGYSKPNAFAYLPTVFTDDTLTVGVTTAKAQHIIELRQAVDALRAVAGLSGAAWTDPALAAGQTIRAVHITDLRMFLDEAAAALGISTSPYVDPGLVSGLAIKRIHIEELRQRIRTIAG